LTEGKDLGAVNSVMDPGDPKSSGPRRSGSGVLPRILKKGQNFTLLRWLLSKGKIVRAEKILRRIAKINKQEVSLYEHVDIKGDHLYTYYIEKERSPARLNETIC
jgi:hypothetical protein